MSARSAPLSTQAARAWSPPEPLVALTIGALVIGLVIRATLGAGEPLWLDETFTGAIAAQPSLAGVTDQILNDVNSPLYYLIAHVWSLLFGLSNASLRFPALVFSVFAPLLCLRATSSLSPRTRLVWCALVALWAPGLGFAQEARCYSLVFCLAVPLAITFAELIDAPSTRRATAWACIGCLAVLAHYHAIVLVAFQGLAFLAIHRRRALRAWPAALVFVPLFVWLAVHGGRIRDFMAPGVAWYARMTPADLFDVQAFVTGSRFLVVAFLAVLVGSALLRAATGGSKEADPDPTIRLGAAVSAATAIAGGAFWIALAFARPTFTMRYLMAFEPGFLLALALAVEYLRRVWRLAPAVLVVLFAKAAVDMASAGPPPKTYNFQTASDALMADGTRDLVFFWDNPANAAEAPSQLAIVGGFFFARRGIDVHVTPLGPVGAADPNPRLLALARGPHAGILWLYDTRVHDTAAKVFPPRIADAPGWTCHDFGAAPVGILACNHRDAAG